MDPSMSALEQHNETSHLSRPEETANITRGARRLLRDMGYEVLTEFTLKNGRRVDLIGVAKNGTITVIEVKSGPEDYKTDSKWHDYLEFADSFFFAVSDRFPIDLLPDDVGLIIADRYGGGIIRDSLPNKVNAARRKTMMLRFSRKAAARLHYALQMLEDLGVDGTTIAGEDNAEDGERN